MRWSSRWTSEVHRSAESRRCGGGSDSTCGKRPLRLDRSCRAAGKLRAASKKQTQYLQCPGGGDSDGHVTGAREPGSTSAASGGGVGSRTRRRFAQGQTRQSRTEAAPLCLRPAAFLLDRAEKETTHYPPTRFALPNMYMVTPPYTVIADKNIGMRTCVGVWALRRPAMSRDGKKNMGSQLMARRIEFCGDIVRRGASPLICGSPRSGRGNLVLRASATTSN